MSENKYMDSFFGVVYGAIITWLYDVWFALLSGFGIILFWYFLDDFNKQRGGGE